MGDALKSLALVAVGILLFPFPLVGWLVGGTLVFIGVIGWFAAIFGN